MISSHPLADIWSIRAAALLAALALHAALFLLVDPRGRRLRSEALPTLRFYEDQLTERTVSIAPTIETRSNAIDRELEVPKLETPQINRERTSTPAPVDWAKESEMAVGSAIDSLIREDGLRAIGPRKPSAVGDPESLPSVVTKPKHKFGDVESDPLGYDRVWHNERCFTDIGKPVSARPDARIGNLNPMKCLRPLGKKQPRGDLFEHLRDD